MKTDFSLSLISRWWGGWGGGGGSLNEMIQTLNWIQFHEKFQYWITIGMII